MFGCDAENNMENTFSYCFLHFHTFSQLPNKYIIQFFNRLTQIRLNSSTPNQKKFIKPGQSHQNPTISQSRTQYDRCRRSQSRTAILASRFTGEVNGCDSKSKLWVRGTKSLGHRRSRNSGFMVRTAPARSHSHTPSLASSADHGASVCGSFRLARCVGRSSQAL